MIAAAVFVFNFLVSFKFILWVTNVSPEEGSVGSGARHTSLDALKKKLANRWNKILFSHLWLM